MYNIMYAGNKGVFDGILSSVISLVKFNAEPIHLYLLTMNLTEENDRYLPISEGQKNLILQILQERNTESTCEVIDLTERFRADGNLTCGERFTPYAMLRLYAAEIPNLPDKVLYLDTDTLILDSLADLFAIDLKDYEYAACRDYIGHWFFGWNYCNSGVLLMNMPQIRKTKLMEKTRQMCVEKNLFLADQTALNKCATKKLILHPRYNRQRRINKDTVIRHYCGSWRFFPYIYVKTVKQWQTEIVFKDKHHVYNNPAVTEILQKFLTLKDKYAPQIL